MRILISNDDGVHAPGLAYLAQSLSSIASVTVIAPDRDKSGSSHSLTLDVPLRVVRMDNGFIQVAGTPTDCVHLGIRGFLPDAPDMVVSGINSGPNLGDDVFYSGTVAAAIEGRFLGKPSIAISLNNRQGGHLETAAHVAKLLVTRLQTHPLPTNVILNVNVPDCSIDELKGLKTTRLGYRHIGEPMVASKDPRGNDIYWIGPPGHGVDEAADTDFYAIKNGYASITPLLVDLTRHDTIPEMSSWVDKITW